MAISSISASTIGRAVPGVSKPRTDSRSVAATINYADVSTRFDYQDSGLYMQFEIVGSSVRWCHDPSVGFVTFLPQPLGRNSDGTVFNSPPDPALLGTPLAVSYDRVRIGDWSLPPEFEMISASSDRVFAKEKGRDNFFLALPTPLYLHLSRGSGSRNILPGTFFKLDPELGTSHDRLRDLILHLRKLDDERHLITERFPIYRALYGLLDALKSKKTRELFQSMDVRVHPFVWIKMDLRPPRGGKGVPSSYPAYTHVTYKKGRQTEAQQSIDFDYVLDLGVGLSNYHEQYEPIYGGEIDVMEEPTHTGMTFDKLYRLASGPIQDIGGFIDGTTIYYLLVRLRGAGNPNNPDKLEARHEETRPNDHFVRPYPILYTDEQQAFMERWRALDLDDDQYASLVGKPIAAYPKAHKTRFDPGTFLDPFKKGFIRSFSRMAVARQVVIVNGLDNPEGGRGKHRLYSIHIGWPTMDRTWRCRDLPVEATLDPDIQADRDLVNPQTLRIREDMTIYLDGAKDVNGEVLEGKWVQKYLPADNQEVPTAAELIAGTATADDTSYTHDWQFYEKTVFDKMHQQFSHFGVYENVKSRCQFYDLKIDNPPGNIEDVIWVDEAHTLKIPRLEVNCAEAGRFLAGIPDWVTRLVAFLFPLSVPALVDTVLWLANNAADRETLPSLYEDKLRFIIKETKRGHIMMYRDKREDKTISFRHLPKKVQLVAEGTHPPVKLPVKVIKQVRTERKIAERGLVSPPEVKRAIVTLITDGHGDTTKVKLQFTSPRTSADFASITEFREWLDINVASAKIGMISPPSGLRGILFDSNDTTLATNDGQFECVWKIAKHAPIRSKLRTLLTNENKIRRGLSVWFTGITGMVNIAEELQFTAIVSKVKSDPVELPSRPGSKKRKSSAKRAVRQRTGKG